MFRGINFIFWILSVAAGIAALILVVSLTHQQDRIDAVYQTNGQVLALADEIRQSSDDLTRFARTYVATGDIAYKERFNKVLDIRDGKIERPIDYEFVYWDLETVGKITNPQFGEKKSIRQRLSDTGYEIDIYHLNMAKNKSDALAKLENDAFRLAESRKNDAALNILFSDEYHQIKSGIMESIREFQISANNRARQKLDEALGQSTQILSALIGSTLASILFGLLAGLFRKAPNVE